MIHPPRWVVAVVVVGVVDATNELAGLLIIWQYNYVLMYAMKKIDY